MCCVGLTTLKDLHCLEFPQGLVAVKGERQTVSKVLNGQVFSVFI